jgi:hypothetical protein
MAWVRLDDTFPEHPKLVAAGPLAGWLWVCGLAYCARYLTDGVIPAAVVPRLVRDTLARRTRYDRGHDASTMRRRCVDDLLNVGLWERDNDGNIVVHDYLEYQPSRAEVLRLRQARADAGHLGGIRSGAIRQAGRKTEAHAQAHAQANASALASESRSKRSSKIEPHPLPSPPMEEKEEEEQALPLLSTTEIPPSTTEIPPLPAWVAALPFPLLPAAWWHETLRLFPKPDHEATARSAAAYWLDHRERISEVRGFLRRQFARAFERYQASLPPDPYATYPVFFDCTCVEGCHVTPPGTTVRPSCPHGAPPP